MHNNLILNIDCYKASHFLQYPPGTEYISSYIEPRGGIYNNCQFFGLQIFLKKYLSKPITPADIAEAAQFFAERSMEFNQEGWQYILEQHGGFLPIEIEAVPEGTLVPVGNIVAQVRNTDPHCFWLTHYIETALLRSIWYPSTVATRSWYLKRSIRKYVDKTSQHPGSTEYKVIDFGARGVSSLESAIIGGIAHMVNFMGIENIAANRAISTYYNEPLICPGVPASEHSTITAWGKTQETQAYANMIAQFAAPGRYVSVVSDSYDLYNAVRQIWGDDLKEAVTNNKGTIVIRPDSGDPVKTSIDTILILMEKFGYEINSKGYKVLPDYVRVIQGEGISPKSLKHILHSMEEKALSADNIVFGMGGELLQSVNRSTMEFAMKASAIQIDGTWRDVFKSPVTDPLKHSKKGILALVRDELEGFKTINRSEIGTKENILKPVFRNGQILTDWQFSQIRAAALI